MNEAQWSRFAAGLLGYISDYRSKFVKTNYKVDLNMSLGEVQQELMEKKSIDELSPQLQKIAREYQDK